MDDLTKRSYHLSKIAFVGVNIVILIVAMVSQGYAVCHWPKTDRHLPKNRTHTSTHHHSQHTRETDATIFALTVTIMGGVYAALTSTLALVGVVTGWRLVLSLFRLLLLMLLCLMFTVCVVMFAFTWVDPLLNYGLQHFKQPYWNNREVGRVVDWVHHAFNCCLFPHGSYQGLRVESCYQWNKNDSTEIKEKVHQLFAKIEAEENLDNATVALIESTFLSGLARQVALRTDDCAKAVDISLKIAMEGILGDKGIRNLGLFLLVFYCLNYHLSCIASSLCLETKTSSGLGIFGRFLPTPPSHEIKEKSKHDTEYSGRDLEQRAMPTIL